MGSMIFHSECTKLFVSWALPRTRGELSSKPLSEFGGDPGTANGHKGKGKRGWKGEVSEDRGKSRRKKEKGKR